MAYMITVECIECGVCEIYCKNDAVSQVGKKFVIDLKKCEECGTCKEYCPIDSAIIKSVVEVQEVKA
jgi:MinD superfamily P-loop ATPase